MRTPKLLALVAAVPVLAALAACTPTSSTFTVTTTSDAADTGTGDGVCAIAGGGCSLRAAIEQANATNSRDTIRFGIGIGPKTIVLGRALPALTQPVVVDGTTQPGVTGGPRIEVDGTVVGASEVLNVAGTNSVVKGLVVNGPDFGVSVTGSGNTIEGNHLGTNIAGTAADTLTVGVMVFGSSNRITGNLVSGNAAEGVGVYGGTGNRVEGNRIGTDVSGTTVIGNGGDGVQISKAPGTVVSGNTISGNASGIAVYGPDATYGCGEPSLTGVRIEGNRIGTDASGGAALGNRDHGVELRNVTAAVVGGTTAGTGNLISGNLGHGVYLEGTMDVCGGGAVGTRIEGNRIGTDAGGSGRLGNLLDGVRVVGVGTLDNVVGGSAAAANRIAFNSGSGVAVGSTFQGAALETVVRANAIFGNGGLGIDLGADGPTANDVGDADFGANRLQNTPTVATARTGGGSTSVQGSLATAAGSYVVEVYGNAACDGSGFGEATTLLGSTTVTVGTSGSTTFSLTAPTGVVPGSVVSATATSAAGDTSELSRCLPVTG